MLDIYGTLEIKYVLDEISVLTHSEISKRQVESLRMLSNSNEVKESLKEVEEMMSIILRHGNLPISSSFDLTKYIETAEKGGILSALDLDHVGLDALTASKVIDYFRRAERSLYPTLNELCNKFFDLSKLEQDIHHIIAPNLEIYDSASDELFSIRKSIQAVEKKKMQLVNTLKNKYSEYLNESITTIKNDHVVLPVQTSQKSKVPGLVYGVSDTGQTTFIEPSELLEVANELYVLHCKEHDEIMRILKVLTQEVISFAPQIISNNNLIAKLDFIAAKSIYGNMHNCNVAIIEDDPVINISGARHPLIETTKVVANDFKMNDKQRIIIISGPNAGGKTVALKTLGLMVMMTQMGLAIPTKTPAILSYFPRVYADIGDNQSLSDNLSTFAAHVSNLSTITHFVTSRDLVLIDELGTGTSPAEGESLALAVTDFLLDKKCFAFISSHFEAMKEYAYRKENVTNAMMVFDEQKLEPTYVLKTGYPGRSYGIEMAKRYRLDDSIVESARDNLNKNHKRDINDVIDKLNKVLRQNEKLNDELKIKDRNLTSKQKDLSHQEKVLESKKENLLEDVNDERERLLNEAKEKIDAALKVLTKPNVKQHELIEAKTMLNNIEFDSGEESILTDKINVNDYVIVAGLGIVGRVDKIKGNKVELVSTDGISIKSTLNKVVKTNQPVERKVHKSNIDDLITLKSEVKLELNIIGEHVDEGVNKVAKYLDDARIRNFHEVRIIHGMGTGALRTAVHEYLKKCDFVSDFHYGGTYDGGTGATIVKLK